MSLIEQYFNIAAQQLEDVLKQQHESMMAVAAAWAEAIEADKMAYSFGSGHSRFIAGELYWRAGGLAPVMQIVDPTNGMAERVEGYAPNFMQEYDIQAGDLLFVVSNSGINAVPIEVAQVGKEVGAVVVAVTNLSYSQNATSRHSSGKKLYEFADHILDTMVVSGDAAVPMPDQDWNVAPTSTLVSVAMLNAIVAQTSQNLLEKGVMPPVLLSANSPGGDEHNKAMVEKFWRRLARFPRRRTGG